MAAINISVIICTHNPKKDFLNRTLEGLKSQSYFYENWELIIVDNASSKAVKENFDISWHPCGRFVTEEKLGLTNARLKGIAEAKGDLLIFFDDDNIPNPDYLVTALKISKERPYIGAFGGQLLPVYEQNPAILIKPYLHLLAIRELKSDKISNQYFCDTSPAGAGLVIKKTIAFKYRNNLLNNPIRNKLGRTGNSLLSGEDTDMVWTSIDEGYLNGLFIDLKLHHIIPKGRVDINYILNLYENIRVSSYLLRYVRFGELIDDRIKYVEKIRLLILFIRKGHFEFKIYRRELNSRRKAVKLIAEIENSVSQLKNE